MSPNEGGCSASGLSWQEPTGSGKVGPVITQHRYCRARAAVPGHSAPPSRLTRPSTGPSPARDSPEQTA